MANNINDLHPRLQEIIPILKKNCEAQGLKIAIGECLRTVAEQDALYAQGRTTSGQIVTNAKGSSYSSQHQWGIAFDFYRNDGTGAYNESGQFFEKVGAAGKAVGLGWGGDWTSFVDRPHLYLPDWGSTPTTLKQKYGTPDKFIATWGTASQPVEAAEVNTNTPTQSSGDEWVRRLQAVIGAKVDGIPGPETHSKCPLIKSGSRGDVVSLYQEKLNALGYPSGNVDGIFGTRTKSATISFQGAKGISKDGIAGTNTWGKILGVL